MVLKGNIARQSWLRHSPFEGVLWVHCQRSGGSPSWRHRRPPEQFLVMRRGAFVATTVKRSHARRVAICAPFEQYSRGGR